MIAAFCGGCTHLPDVGGMPLPKLTAQPPAVYRNLTDIPEPPAVTSPNASEAAVGVLSQERGTTEHAADELRGEAFITPAPAPPQTPF